MRAMKPNSSRSMSSRRRVLTGILSVAVLTAMVSGTQTTRAAAADPLVFGDPRMAAVVPSNVGVPIPGVDVSDGPTGGVPPYTFSATGLPDGITIDPVTGVIAGSPTTVTPAGTAVLTVTDAAAATAQRTIPLGAVSATPPGTPMDSQVVSIEVNSAPYTGASAPFSIPADHVFVLDVTLKNTGTLAWGVPRADNQHGFTLLARNPNINSNFGTFFITPGQGSLVVPGDVYRYHAALRAPSTPGSYAMTWQAADWFVPEAGWGGGMPAQYAPFFGETVTVQVTVTDPTTKPPTPPAKPGVLTADDFQYEGSFALPDVPNTVGGDEKVFFNTGITLETVGGEKRLLADTGTYSQTLYDMAIPAQLGDYSSCNASAVPTAAFRTNYGAMAPTGTGGYNVVGSMWYDPASSLFYWAEYNWYYAGGFPMNYPLIHVDRLTGGVMTEVAAWYQPADLGGAPPKAFWGGVTGIPQSFANQYTGGRTLGVGFGGTMSINATTSFGPAIAAAATNVPAGGTADMVPIMYSSISDRSPRDGNYFSNVGEPNPADPWTGWWTQNDTIGTGVFIDLPDKKGYVTFAKQGIGRISYDWGGPTWFAQNENTWYFYDLDALGQAATGKIPQLAMAPSSFSTINLPCDTNAQQTITGSAFDPATRELYVYAKWAIPGGMYYQPLVHVYKVKQDSTPASVQAVIDAINGLPDPVRTWTDADQVARVVNMMATLTPNLASQVPQAVLDRLARAESQAGPVNRVHASAGAAVTGGASLPWQVRLVVTPVASSDARWSPVASKLPGRTLLALYDVRLVDTLTGAAVQPPPGQIVTVQLTGVPVGTAVDIGVVHVNADATLSAVPSRVTGQTVVFDGASFSLYGVAGTVPGPTPGGSGGGVAVATGGTVVTPDALALAVVMVLLAVLMHGTAWRRRGASA